MFIRLFLTSLFVVGIGCGNHPGSPEAGASTANPKPSPAVTPGSGNEALVGSAETAAVLGDLTQLVRKFGLEQRRAPKSLEELVTNGYLTNVPPAPPGKRFVIDKKLEVNLANQ